MMSFYWGLGHGTEQKHLTCGMTARRYEHRITRGVLGWSYLPLRCPSIAGEKSEVTGRKVEEASVRMRGVNYECREWSAF